jgi:hypothetical protein
MESSQPQRRWWTAFLCQDVTQEDRRNQYRFVVRCLAWAISFVAATFILEARELSRAASLVVALVPTVLGVTVVWAYVTFIRHADELLRKIHMEALALGFGAGVIFMLSYRLFERAGAPELDISDPLLVMLLVWTAGQLVLTRRYA